MTDQGRLLDTSESHGEPGQVMPSAALFSPDVPPGRADSLAEVPVPEGIGRYRVVAVVGSGGMGVVYEAWQEEPRRRVAVKVLHAAAAGRRSLLQRFRHEAQILARLQHPGIAQVIESGSYDTGEGGRPYLAMEFVQGVAVTEYAERRRLPVPARMELLARVCDAVHHAHVRGVVHRDLKPANILVVEPEPGAAAPDEVENVQIKILDFGIARITDADIQVTTVYSDPGVVLGTLPYMSPEQAVGDSDEVDLRSDVYSLGVVAYRLLSDRLPLDLERSSMYEAMRRICEETPPPLGRVARPLRGDIETIVAKALEKDKRRRYQSASELAEDIRRYQRNEPIVARPPGVAYQVRKFAARHKALVAGALAAVLALSAGATVALWQAIRARRSEAMAVDRFNDVRGLANSVIFDLEEAIAGLRGSTPARKLLVERALEYLRRLSQGASDDPGLASELIAAYTKVGSVQGNPTRASLGDPIGALTTYGRALALAELAGPEAAEDDLFNNRRIGLHHRVGETHQAMGNLDEAAKHFEAARAIAAQTCLARPRAVAVRHSYVDSARLLAGVLSVRGEPAAAAAVGRETMAFIDSMLELDPSDPEEVYRLGMTWFALGRVWQSASLPAIAIEQFDRGFPLARAAYDAVPDQILFVLGVANIQWYRGIARQEMGDVDGALADLDAAGLTLERARALQPTRPGPRLAWSYVQARVAGLLAGTGDPSAAIDRSRASVQEFERIHADFPASMTYVDTAIQGNSEHANLLLRIAGDADRPECPRTQRIELIREARRHWHRCGDLLNAVATPSPDQVREAMGVGSETLRGRIAETDRLLRSLHSD